MKKMKQMEVREKLGKYIGSSAAILDLSLKLFQKAFVANNN